MEKKLVITQYTDPMCIWCYALEPGLRKIDVLLGEQVEFHNVMGMLVSDARQIIGDDAFSEMRFEQLRQQMTSHFLDAANASGMPVSVEHMKTCTPDRVTSVPMSTAFEAMKLVDENIANAYLRRMRESAHAEDRWLSEYGRLIELAAEFPIDIEQFKANLESGRASEALKNDMYLCQAAGVRSFPTMVMKYGDRKLGINGFRDYETLKRAAEQVSEGEIVLEDVPYSTEALVAYVNRFGKVAAQEVKVMFSLSDEQLEAAVDELVGSGLFEKAQRGTSYFVSLKRLMACDPATGECKVA